ncbi:hypothetical protein L9F63_027475, partial [Diploptera punctata]
RRERPSFNSKLAMYHLKLYLLTQNIFREEIKMGVQKRIQKVLQSLLCDLVDLVWVRAISFGLRKAYDEILSTSQSKLSLLRFE